MELPTSLKMENAKGKLLSTLNDVSVEYNLPAFILEGVLADILADVRAQAKIEILNDMNLILDEKNKEIEDLKKESEKIDNNNEPKS